MQSRLVFEMHVDHMKLFLAVILHAVVSFAVADSESYTGQFVRSVRINCTQCRPTVHRVA